MKKLIALMLTLCMAVLPVLPVMAEPLPEEAVLAAFEKTLSEVLPGMTVEKENDNCYIAYGGLNLAGVTFCHAETDGTVTEGENNSVMIMCVFNPGGDEKTLSTYSLAFIGFGAAMMSALEGTDFSGNLETVSNAMSSAVASETGASGFLSEGYNHIAAAALMNESYCYCFLMTRPDA